MITVLLRLFTVALVIVASRALPSAHATDIPAETVVLRGLDKVSGRAQTFKGAVGQTLTFGNLQIVARTCVMHPPEEPPENAAFLEISQVEPKAPAKPIFSGWMFSSNPAISAMDNPVYDIWVLRCENSTPSKSP